MKKDQTLTLPSEVEIPFRVVRPADAPALQRLLGRCSERTIYLRFFGSMKKLSEEKARYFASTDDLDYFGLVALDPQDQNEIIVVARYARTPGDERAEYAALVEDRWQGVIPGIALAAVRFGAYHIGTFPLSGVVTLLGLGAFFGVLFRATGGNLLALWPLTWAVTSSIGVLEGGFGLGWSDVATYALLLIVQVVLIALAVRKPRF